MARRNLSYLKNSLLFLVGLPCGVFTGSTGIATSTLLLPLLGYLLAVRGTKASGTSLAVTLSASVVAILSYSLQKDVLWGLAILLAVGQIIGAVCGQRLAERVPFFRHPTLLGPILFVVIGMGMIANGVGWPERVVPGRGWGMLSPSVQHDSLVFLISAFLLSFAVGLVSRLIAYGGILLVPIEIYGLRLAAHAAQGTALFVLVLASLPAMLIQAKNGAIEMRSAVWISAGAVFGSLIGAFYAAHVYTAFLLVSLYGVVLTIMGIGLLWRREKPDAEA